MGKEALIVELTDDYKQRKLQGEDPDLQDYIKAHPEVAEEIKADIEAWEWLHQMAGTRDFLATSPSMEETWDIIRSRL